MRLFSGLVISTLALGTILTTGCAEHRSRAYDPYYGYGSYYGGGYNGYYSNYYYPAATYYNYYAPAPVYYSYYATPYPYYNCWRWRYGYRYRVC